MLKIISKFQNLEFSIVNLRVSKFQNLNFEIPNSESQRLKLGISKCKTLTYPILYHDIGTLKFHMSKNFSESNLKFNIFKVESQNLNLKFPSVLQILNLDCKNFEFQG